MASCRDGVHGARAAWWVWLPVSMRRGRMWLMMVQTVGRQGKVLNGREMVLLTTGFSYKYIYIGRNTFFYNLVWCIKQWLSVWPSPWPWEFLPAAEAIRLTQTWGGAAKQRGELNGLCSTVPFCFLPGRSRQMNLCCLSDRRTGYMVLSGEGCLK